MQFEIHQETVTRLTSLRNGGGDWRWELLNDDRAILVGGGGYASQEECSQAVEFLRSTDAGTRVVTLI